MHEDISRIFTTPTLVNIYTLHINFRELTLDPKMCFICCRPWKIFYEGEDGVGTSVVADGFSLFIRDRIEFGSLSLASRATGDRQIGSMGESGYMFCQASDMFTDKQWEDVQKPTYVAIGIALWFMVSFKDKTTEYPDFLTQSSKTENGALHPAKPSSCLLSKLIIFSDSITIYFPHLLCPHLIIF